MARKKKKQEWLTFTEKDKRFMQCQHCRSEYVSVEPDVVAVTCSHCVIQRTLALKPIESFGAKRHKKTGRPSGWQWMKEFVDKDGTVYHKGKEQPELKGTLKPTKVKPRKKVVKKKTDGFSKLAKDHKEKLKIKRALKKQKDFLNGKVDK